MDPMRAVAVGMRRLGPTGAPGEEAAPCSATALIRERGNTIARPAPWPASTQNDSAPHELKYVVVDG